MTDDARRRIMVVDDDADVRLLLEAALSDKYEVAHAHDGLDALEKLEKYEPDFIIMDLVMPLMNGIEACQAIRKIPQYQNIQVLFLSAHDSREEIAKTYACGGNLFLSKPIDPDRLLRNIDLSMERFSPPPHQKRMSILQIKLMEKVEKEARKKAPTPSNVPRRALAPQAGPKIERKVLQRQEALPTQARNRGAGAGGSFVPRILFVEDNKDLSEVVTLALEEFFEVVVAYDGLEAVEKIVKYQPDILLIDVMLPKMNGYQLCESVRANRAFAEIPIVFVTGKATARDRDYALNVGGDFFLGKPFSIEDLVAMCKTATGKEGFLIRTKTLSILEIRAAERRDAKEAISTSTKRPFDKQGRFG